MKKQSMTDETKYYCIDLFAGCGGLSLGLEQAGFTPLLFSEINESAAKTYIENMFDLLSSKKISFSGTVNFQKPVNVIDNLFNNKIILESSYDTMLPFYVAHIRYLNTQYENKIK